MFRRKREQPSWPWREPVTADWCDGGPQRGILALLALLLVLSIVLFAFAAARDPAVALVLGGVWFLCLAGIFVLAYWRERRPLVHYRLTLTPDRAVLAPVGPGPLSVTLARDAVARMTASSSGYGDVFELRAFDRSDRELIRLRDHAAALRVDGFDAASALPAEAPAAVALMTWAAAGGARIGNRWMLPIETRWRGPWLLSYERWQRRRLRWLYGWAAVYAAGANVLCLYSAARDVAAGRPEIALSFGPLMLVVDLLGAGWLLAVHAFLRRRGARLQTLPSTDGSGPEAA